MRNLRLTNNAFLVATLLVAASFFVGVVPPLRIAVPAAWLVSLVVCAADLLSLTRLPRPRPKLTIPRLPELGLPTPLKLEVANASIPVRFRVLAPNAVTLEFENEAFEVTDTQTGFTAHISGTAVKLGFDRITGVNLELLSHFRLWKRALPLDLERPCEFRVMPSRHHPPEQWLKENAHVVAALAGNRRVMRGSEPDLFHSLRDYQYGDSRRFLDAKKWAKLGRPITRTFETEKQHQVVVALDVGNAMKGTIARSDKLDYYLALSLAILENAVAAGDNASFFAFSRDVHCLLPRVRDHRELDILFRRGPELEPREALTDYQLLIPTVGRLAPRRAIVILLSDLTRPSVHEPVRDAIALLARKHLTVAVSLQDRAHAVDQLVLDTPAHGVSEDDVSNLVYACWVEEQQATLHAALKRLGVASLSVPEDYWISAVTRLYESLRSSAMV